MTRKSALYLKNGASAVWIIYPRKQTVHILTSSSATILKLDDSLPLPPPLPNSLLPVKDIFTTKTL